MKVRLLVSCSLALAVGVGCSERTTNDRTDYGVRVLTFDAFSAQYELRREGMDLMLLAWGAADAHAVTGTLTPEGAAYLDGQIATLKQFDTGRVCPNPPVGGVIYWYWNDDAEGLDGTETGTDGGDDPAERDYDLAVCGSEGGGPDWAGPTERSNAVVDRYVRQLEKCQPSDDLSVDLCEG